MKNILICEGSTDLTFLQYFLEKVYNWEYISQKDYRDYADVIDTIRDAELSKWFKHSSGNFLCIMSAGGVSKIPNRLSGILDLNNLGTTMKYRKIAILSDRDEVNTEIEFITKLREVFTNFSMVFNSEILHNKWNIAHYTDIKLEESDLIFLPLIIPFEDTGSIENFLLDALSVHSEQNDSNEIDKLVIMQCKQFIDNLDSQNKYLTHRREITKAKFDTVFVVMTPETAFHQRGMLLRSIPWEKYESIQHSFIQLSRFLET